MLKEDFFSLHPLTCAAELIGCELHWDRCSGVIVETEAYTAVGDEACHTFLRRGAQKFVDTHPAGTAYIYLNYGIHWLLNVLIKGEMDGFVLIRALEPRLGLPLMQERRGMDDRAKLCSGPGKLTQALAISPTVHGSSLCHDPERCFQARPPGEPVPAIVSDVRIGISRAADLPWRFLLQGSRYVSRGRAGRGTSSAGAGAGTSSHPRLRQKSRAIPGGTTRPDKPSATERQRLPALRQDAPTPQDYFVLVVVGGRRNSGGAGRCLRRAGVQAADGGCRQGDKGQEFDGLHMCFSSFTSDLGWSPFVQTVAGREDFATRIARNFRWSPARPHASVIRTSVPGDTILNNSTTSALRIRTHPWLAGSPMFAS